MSDVDKQHIALHKAEVKELQRQYDRDLRLQDFLSIKGKNCINVPGETCKRMCITRLRDTHRCILRGGQIRSLSFFIRYSKII